MKKIQDLVKPFLCILLGALVLFYYLNDLSLQGNWLAVGIIAVVIACLYLCIGILNVTLGDKLPAGFRKVLSIAAIVMFPLFTGISFLLYVIDLAQIEGALGPNGWVVNLTCIIAAFSFVVLYIIQELAKSSAIRRISLLFASIFALTLVVDALFTLAGDPITLGQIDIVYLLIDIIYVYMLFDACNAMRKQVAKAEAPAEEPVEEAEEPEEEPEEEPAE